MKTISEKKFRFYNWNSQEYQEAIKIRQVVLRFPLGINYSENDFEMEKDEKFFGCFLENGKIVASISAKELENKTWKMRQFAVHPTFQREGIGKKLVDFYENEARKKKISKIELHARKTAVRFYLKLGYQVISEEFFEVGIPHCKMKKQL